MWSATRPQSVGRYGWRPSPAEPGRVVDIVYFGTQFAIDATGHVAEGGEWWQGPVYAWEQSINAELLAAAKNAREPLLRLASNEYACADDIESATLMEAAIMRAEQQPADTRDAEIARLRSALESIMRVGNMNAVDIARKALGEKA